MKLIRIVPNKENEVGQEIRAIVSRKISVVVHKMSAYIFRKDIIAPIHRTDRCTLGYQTLYLCAKFQTCTFYNF